MVPRLPTAHKRFDLLCESRPIDLCKWKQPDPGRPLETTEQREALPAGALYVHYHCRVTRSTMGSAAVQILPEHNYADGQDSDHRNRRSFSSTVCPRHLYDSGQDYFHLAVHRSKRPLLRYLFSTETSAQAGRLTIFWAWPFHGPLRFERKPRQTR